MSAYIKQLNRMLETASVTQPQLQQRFQAWYNSLPEITRTRPFSMIEFERALGTQGKYISQMLLELGWQRRRRWSSQRQYHRFWVPPQPDL
ncbi:hypothetical protein J8I87_33895 [Paraburkholderia sp. LEh10]|uniref:hypothetical protein n=1 Tax=Paraburkholderia sp. LEh10 TaxID=2821353 RepID=UPI001AE7CE9D|nr:hypothetical protein [Paraburkholderia sp. LEh10]MBP0594568.1 hypothetical protein [Paraburkholderia sp. LEh10]